MNDRKVIEIEGLTVRYGRLTAVDGLGVTVPAGCVYALLGRNGSGKSSTVRCLVGQRCATSGTVCVFGLDAWRSRRKIMERVGVVPEHPDIPPDSDARRVERFLARVTPYWRRKDFFGRLDAFRISHTQQFGRLSKGQQRQMALAIALASSPKLLVLDDPTLGLDAVARRELFEELIGELADRGTTVFLTSHDLAGIEAIANRVGILDGGRLKLDESIEALKMRFCRLTWTGAEDVPEEKIRSGLDHLDPVHMETLGGTGEAIVSTFSEVGFGKFRELAPVEVRRVRALSLEEIFIALCGEQGGAS
jgi:ABC-2 type transport system ATP-binding protein